MTIPNAAIDSCVATNCPRDLAFEVSATQVGTVPVFIPLPMPCNDISTEIVRLVAVMPTVITRPTIIWATLNDDACNIVP